MVRQAEGRDLFDVYRIYCQRYESGDASAIKYTEGDFEWYLNAGGNSRIFVVEEEGKVVGFSLVYDMGLWGYLEFIVVDRHHREAGHARKLMDRIYELAVVREWSTIEACYYEGSHMKDFAKHMGYEDGGITTRWVFRDVL